MSKKHHTTLFYWINKLDILEEPYKLLENHFVLYSIYNILSLHIA